MALPIDKFFVSFLQIRNAIEECMNVLVIDDEPFIVEEIVEFFAATGIMALGAGSVAQARTQLSRVPPGHFTVVVTDVAMPGKDGLAFSQEIRAGQTDEYALAVIVITGHGDRGMAAKAQRRDVFDFIIKPLHLSELLATVRRANAWALACRARFHDAANRGGDLPVSNDPVAQWACDIVCQALHRRLSEACPPAGTCAIGAGTRL